MWKITKLQAFPKKGCLLKHSYLDIGTVSKLFHKLPPGFPEQSALTVPIL